MKKKLIIFSLLVCLLAIFIVACNNGGTQGNDNTENENIENDGEDAKNSEESEQNA